MSGPPARAQVLDRLAGPLAALDLGHPVRVAVEGITASGKTTFAGDLAGAVVRRGRAARTLTMDGFHHPQVIRRRQGRLSADGYYEDAYDLESFRRLVLDPLGPDVVPGTPRRAYGAVIDLGTDQPVEGPAHELVLEDDEVLVVDGSFLAKPLLSEGWDVRIWLDVPFEVALARGIERDAALLGGRAEAAELFDQRYHAAFRRYLAEVDPAATADAVVDNADPAAPTLTLHPRGRLTG